LRIPFFAGNRCEDITLQAEGIVRITGMMLLRLGKSVKVPERGLERVVGGHPLESKEVIGPGKLLRQY